MKKNNLNYDPYEEGVEAFNSEMTLLENPYDEGTNDYDEWEAGFTSQDYSDEDYNERATQIDENLNHYL